MLSLASLLSSPALVTDLDRFGGSRVAIGADLIDCQADGIYH
jgi:hypothetical protein